MKNTKINVLKMDLVLDLQKSTGKNVCILMLYCNTLSSCSFKDRKASPSILFEKLVATNCQDVSALQVMQFAPSALPGHSILNRPPPALQSALPQTFMQPLIFCSFLKCSKEINCCPTSFKPVEQVFFAIF